MTDQTREALAAYAHAAWSGWMEYLFSKTEDAVGGGVVIPNWAVERWKRQASTPYDLLPDAEKESDRAEADKILALLPRPSEDAEALAREIHLRIFEQDEIDSDYLQIRKDEAIEWAARVRQLAQPDGLSEDEVATIAGAVTGYRECGNDFYADQLQVIVSRLKGETKTT